VEVRSTTKGNRTYRISLDGGTLDGTAAVDRRMIR
jgi:hypothetical protein